MRNRKFESPTAPDQRNPQLRFVGVFFQWSYASEKYRQKRVEHSNNNGRHERNDEIEKISVLNIGQRLKLQEKKAKKQCQK